MHPFSTPDGHVGQAAVSDGDAYDRYTRLVNQWSISYLHKLRFDWVASAYKFASVQGCQKARMFFDNARAELEYFTHVHCGERLRQQRRTVGGYAKHVTYRMNEHELQTRVKVQGSISNDNDQQINSENCTRTCTTVLTHLSNKP